MCLKKAKMVLFMSPLPMIQMNRSIRCLYAKGWQSERQGAPSRNKNIGFRMADRQTYRSIWQYLGLHDLVGRITWETAPIDDPAYEMFQDLVFCMQRSKAPGSG